MATKEIKKTTKKGSKKNPEKNKVEWFLPNPDGLNEALGPLTAEYIMEEFADENLHLDSFVWNSSLEEQRWYRIFELKDFVKRLETYPKGPLPKKRSKGRSSQVVKVNFDYKQEGEYGIENEYRRYPRAPLKAEVIVHNQKIHCEGVSVDISEKGMYITIEDPSIFKRGEEVVVTLVEDEYFGTFSIPSVVMNLIDRDSSKGCGLYFLRLNPQIKRKIAEYVVKELHATRECQAEPV